MRVARLIVKPSYLPVMDIVTTFQRNNSAIKCLKCSFNYMYVT